MASAMRRTNHYVDGMATDATDRGRAFAQLIRAAREEKGWTQDDVVAESGIPKSTYVRWEGGRVERPDPDQVRIVCRSLGINPTEAAIALGYLTVEDVTPPERDASPLDRKIREVIDALEDPEFLDSEKQQLVDYLQFLRYQRDQRRGHRRAAG